ncbi:MAG: putative lipid kinase [Firmicutes bacterium ADurb.Bin099]|jgi:YegS/Rv2252/BmrU family lipid kinase|nr:MAG: putative lipid kinase [Firmicutes bacterium ADurb.Bin099]
MKHLFIMNPMSGSKKAAKFLPDIERYFEGREDEYSILYAQHPTHIKELCEEYAKKGGYRIYVAGGDGSVNQAANGVAGYDTPIGILPTGSGNDFIKNLTDYAKLKDLVKRTVEGDVIKVDAIKLYDEELFGYCINILSIGVDAEAAYNSTQITRKYGITGMLAYLLGFFRVLRQKKTKFDVKITIDGQVINDGYVMLAACTNGKYYGGGFIPVPHTSFDDGIIDMCIAEARGLDFVFSVLPKYMKGKHAGTVGIIFPKGKSISLESKDMLKVNIEGEIIERRSIRMEIMPRLISFIKPKDLQE